MSLIHHQIDVLLSVYENDRSEERMRKNNLYTIFSSFILLLVGMVNVFVSKGVRCSDNCGVFVFSMVIVCVLYSVLQWFLIRDLNYVERCKKGREILIKSAVNGVSFESIVLSDLENDHKWITKSCLRERLEMEDEARACWENMDSKDFPFFEFEGVKVKQSKHWELLVMVWIAGIMGVGFILA